PRRSARELRPLPPGARPGRRGGAGGGSSRLMATDARLEAFASDEELLTRDDAKHLVRRLWRLLHPYLGRIAVATLLIMVWSLCLLSGPALVRHGIDAGLQGKDEGALDLSAALFLAVAVGGLLFARAAIWSVSKVGEPFLRDLRN